MINIFMALLNAEYEYSVATCRYTLGAWHVHLYIVYLNNTPRTLCIHSASHADSPKNTI